VLSIVAVFCTVRPMSRTTITRQVVTMRVMPRAVRFTLLQGEGGIGTHSLDHSIAYYTLAHLLTCSHTHTLTHSHTLAHTHSLAHTLTHSHTHTLTHSLSHLLLLVLLVPYSLTYTHPYRFTHNRVLITTPSPRKL
jgi:hypothetical protein